MAVCDRDSRGRWDFWAKHLALKTRNFSEETHVGLISTKILIKITLPGCMKDTDYNMIIELNRKITTLESFENDQLNQT